MTDKRSKPLRAVLVGCGGMGGNQARNLSELDEFELVAVCDNDAEQAQRVADATGAKAYTDFAAMLEAEQPETVSVCTPNASHAPLTIQAARFDGVRGVYCEKPMATNIADARAMVRTCRENDVALVINHQRRLGADLVEARRLLDTGAIGDVRLVRGNCAGDMLSDGTHLIDSLQWLTGDQDAEWLLGQVHREPPEEGEGGTGADGKQHAVAPGYRYGHVVETGALGVYQLASGVRVELYTGDLREPRSIYQTYEIFGTAGRLWRTGDRARPNLFIQDAQGGPLCGGMGDHGFLAIPAPDREQAGIWRAVDVPEPEYRDAKMTAYKLFARMIREGAYHPMNGDNALRGAEIIMSIYESARLHRKITPPLRQDRFPLELMVEEK